MHVLSYQEARVVQNDGTVSWCNRHFQLGEEPHKLTLAKQRIVVRELRDGTIRLMSRGRELTGGELTERPSRKRSKLGAPKAKRKKPPKPAADPPWRRRCRK